jgi:hypothetical protein
MLFVLFLATSPFFMVGLSAALTYSRAVAHSMSRSGRLPIHTPDRYLGQGHFGRTNHEKLLMPELEAFHPFTHTKLLQ